MFQSGFISIVGRPNTGKSTLLNALVGEKIAIATPKAQTTRNRILGIRNGKEAQFVFVDTPGMHAPATPLHRQMVHAALDALAGSDQVFFLTEAQGGIHPEDRPILEKLPKESCPVLLVINKTDLVARPSLLPLMDAWRRLREFAAIVPVSARTGEGLDRLLEAARKLLPESPPPFPEDMLTDLSERFLAAEIIREKVTLLTRKEIPYATAVVVEAFKEDPERGVTRIEATIHVEKDSQKGILIGRRGAMLREIGTQARRDLEAFFASRIFLSLFVRVQKNWTKDKRMLKEFGYLNP